MGGGQVNRKGVGGHLALRLSLSSRWWCHWGVVEKAGKGKRQKEDWPTDGGRDLRRGGGLAQTIHLGK